MSNLHQYYDQLTSDEREFVDEAMREIFNLQKLNKQVGMFAPPLSGNDSAEIATDGIARWVIESRPKLDMSILDDKDLSNGVGLEAEKAGL